MGGREGVVRVGLIVGVMGKKGIMPLPCPLDSTTASSEGTDASINVNPYPPRTYDPNNT